MSEQHIKNIFDKYKINIIFPKSNTSAGLLPDILSDNPERRYTEAYNEYKSMVNYNTCLVSHGLMVFHQLIAVGGSHHGSPNYCAWIARFKNEYLLDLSKLIKNNQTQAGLVRGPSGPPWGAPIYLWYPGLPFRYYYGHQPASYNGNPDDYTTRPAPDPSEFIGRNIIVTNEQIITFWKICQLLFCSIIVKRWYVSGCIFLNV